MALSINPDTVCFVVAKAREVNVKVAPEELADDGDNMERILEDYADDSAYRSSRHFSTRRATTSFVSCWR